MTDSTVTPSRSVQRDQQAQAEDFGMLGWVIVVLVCVLVGLLGTAGRRQP